MDGHRLDRSEARRIAVRAQLLGAQRPTDLLAMVRHLTLLQLDPTAAVAPNADLVAWTRLGAAYQPARLQQALERDRTMFEYRATIRPMDDIGRALELFDFDYKLEMYVPKAARRWGYFALPVLHGDRLVGTVDATADRKASVLRVDAIHPDVRFTKPITSAVRAELSALACWLGLGGVHIASTTR
jgi:uncharacterized protein YcaQ